ncbi:phasin family protein [Moorella sp. Hama-1]|uniref:phasin family protein n=1 Tax=Moorella sp. Hama-1 TaxID=2138101 RepID=UPI000D6560F5|nr:polyhydroxyalkanoate synthesis regulator [Moorella sp. Hama-1]BCV21079.1 ATP synthase subunit B [Moorella sp. Hama-1]
MKELVRKAFALGWGALALTREAVEKLADELVKKGEMGQGEARELVNDLLERGKKEREEAQKVIRQEMERVLGELNLPSRDDLLRLEEKVDRLLQRGAEKQMSRHS